ncbi:MAG: alpha/beta hydrolase, partial [Candidatus Kapaibacterium sp.]
YVAPEEIVVRSTVAKGRFTDTSFGSGTIAKRTVRVYLPPGFDLSSARFPVVLFHDGLDYWNLGSVGTILDNLIADKKIMPLIAVFVPAQERVPEYRTTKREAYMSFICDTVVGWLRKKYPVIESPAYRAVVGASDGGHCALYQGVMRPDVFGKIGAQSSNVTSLITDRLKADPKLTTDFHLDIGMYDIPQLIPLVRNLRSLLDARGYGYAYKEVNEGHSWGNWRARVGAILMRFFPLEPTGVVEEQRQVAAPAATLAVMCMPVSEGEPMRLCTSLRGDVLIRISDIQGRSMLEAEGYSDDAGRVEVDTWRLRAGMYVVSLRSSSGTVSCPFIVLH